MRIVILLSLINVLAFVTRYILNAVEPLLKAEFSLTNEQSGTLVGAFVIGYVLCSPLFGFLGDRYARPKLMAFGAMLWSTATIFGACVSGYSVFYLTRIFVGIGEAAFCTLSPAYIKDTLGNPEKVTKAFSYLFGAIPVGAALGFTFGGVLSNHFSWRTAFIIISSLSIPFALWLLLQKESRKETPKIQVDMLAGVKAILSVRLIRYAIGGYILQAFALNGIASFLIRHGISLGFEFEEINSYFGIILVVAGIVGTLFGARYASTLASRSDQSLHAMLRFIGLITLIGTPVLGLALVVQAKYLFLGLCFVAELLLFAATAPVNTVIVSAAPKNLENLTQGVSILTLNVLGTMLSPYVIGLATDSIWRSGFAGSFGLPVTESGSLAIALQLSTVAMFFCGITWILGGRAKHV